jgi:hypothetical protein
VTATVGILGSSRLRSGATTFPCSRERVGNDIGAEPKVHGPKGVDQGPDRRDDPHLFRDQDDPGGPNDPQAEGVGETSSPAVIEHETLGVHLPSERNRSELGPGRARPSASVDRAAE